MQTKVCSKCGEEKTIDMFKKGPAYRFGVNSRCRICTNKINIEYDRNNRGKASDRQMRYAKRNKEKINSYRRKLTFNNRENFLDPYIKDLLIKNGFTTKQIKQYPELIETKRLLIKTKRLCKTS